MLAVQAQSKFSQPATPLQLNAEPALIKAAQHQDMRAFNQLVRTYQGELYRTAFRILGESDAASDATQEAFIAAYKHIQSFRDGSFRAWLMRIVTNACYDQLREKQRRPTVSLDAMLTETNNARVDTEPVAPILPQDAAERHELNEAIQRGLEVLPVDQRVTLILADIDEFAYEEIARIMNTNPGTVKSRLSRARSSLREILMHQGFVPQTCTAKPNTQPKVGVFNLGTARQGRC